MAANREPEACDNAWGNAAGRGWEHACRNLGQDVRELAGGTMVQTCMRQAQRPLGGPQGYGRVGLGGCEHTSGERQHDGVSVWVGEECKKGVLLHATCSEAQGPRVMAYLGPEWCLYSRMNTKTGVSACGWEPCVHLARSEGTEDCDDVSGQVGKKRQSAQGTASWNTVDLRPSQSVAGR